MPDEPGHKKPADDLFRPPQGGDIFAIGQTFQSIRRDDGSIIVLNRNTGEPKRNFGPGGPGTGPIMELSPAAPPDPAKPNIEFFTDPNSGTFFALDLNKDGSVRDNIEVISERALEGFQHIAMARVGVTRAGLDPDNYEFLYEGGRVIPVLREIVPPAQDSFSVAADANGQLLVISRLTGAATRLENTPKASDIARDATVTIDPTTGKFKVTQPDGSISFPEALNPRELQNLGEVEIGGQFFAFNSTTGQFQQVDQPRREFDPDVVTIDGRQFTQGPDGRLTPLGREFDPGVVTQNGRAFLQQPDGSLSPLGREEVPNLDELINARILSGDAEGALALADFRDRPTSLEAFNAAMQFAQSPGDVAAISAISRGQSLVQPPPTGDVQRIAQQPEFLQDAFQRLMGQFRGEGPEGFEDVLARINREERGDTGITGIDSLLDFRTGRVGDPNEATRQGNIAINEAFQLVADSLFADFPEGRARNRQINNFRSQMVREQAAGVGPITVESILSRGRAKLKDKQKAAADRQALEAITDSGDPFRGGETFTPEEAALFVPDGAFDREVFDALIAERQEFARTNNNEDDDSDDDSEVESPSEPDSPSESPSEESASESLSDISDHESFVDEFDEDDFFAGGGTFDDNTAIVGENGEELIIAAPGTRVVSLGGGKKAKSAAARLRKAGIRSMQDGGVVEPLLPFGVRRALSGGTIEPTRRRLSRAAGLPILSAQARQNLLPEELEVFNRLSREAGIPEGAFRQEQESAFPGANLARGRARFAPRVLR